MNTCGTCKYFGTPELGTSDVIYVPDGYHVCTWIKRARERGIVPEPALVVDGSDYYAALCVKEDFGCNQWCARKAMTHE